MSWNILTSDSFGYIIENKEESKRIKDECELMLIINISNV